MAEETKVIGNDTYVLGRYKLKATEKIAADSLTLHFVPREDPAGLLEIVWLVLKEKGVATPDDVKGLAMGRILTKQAQEGPIVRTSVNLVTMHNLAVFFSLKKWTKNVDGKEVAQPLNLDYFYENFDPNHVDILWPIAEKVNRLSEPEKNSSLTPLSEVLGGQAGTSSIETPSPKE